MALTKTQIAMIEASGTAGSGNFLRGDGAWSNVGVSQLSATGTPSSSTFLRGDGSWNAPASGLTAMTAVASTSGTSIDFTSIPAGVKRITVMFSGVSLNAASEIMIQLGTSGTPKTSGYSGRVGFAGASFGTAAFSTGFITFVDSSAANTHHGNFNICLLDSATNTWSYSGISAASDVAYVSTGGGSVALSGVLNMVRITSLSGTDTFDAGSINVFYEL